MINQPKRDGMVWYGREWNGIGQDRRTQDVEESPQEGVQKTRSRLLNALPGREENAQEEALSQTLGAN